MVASVSTLRKSSVDELQALWQAGGNQQGGRWPARGRPASLTTPARHPDRPAEDASMTTRLLALAALALALPALGADPYGDISGLKLARPEDKEHARSTP